MPASGAQQIEILPIQRATVIGRREQDQTEQLVIVDQGHSGPGVFVIRDPGGDADLEIRWVAPAPAIGVELEDSAGSLKFQPEISRGL